MTIYIYCRVSTAEQVEKGESLPAQIKRCKAWLVTQGHDEESATIIQEEAVSGGKPLADRPAGGPMIQALKTGDIVVAWKLDRMFRDTLDALNVAQKFRTIKASLVLMDTGGDVINDAMGELFFTMLAAFAKLERVKIAERMQEGKRSKIERGMHTGGLAPFGWKSVKFENGKKLVEDEDQQKVLQRLNELRAGGSSYEIISDHMLNHFYIKKHPSTWMRIYDRGQNRR